MMEGVEGPRELAVCLRRARGRSTLCQGARESVPGRHAADGRARGGVWPRGRGPIGVRGARYGSGPSIGRAGSGRARRPPSPMPRHAPRRMRGPGGGFPVGRRQGRKKLTPPERPRIYPGRPGITHCHSRKNALPTSLRARDVARPLALPPKLFPNDPHSCEYATKEGDGAPLQGRCSANVHLSEGPGRHRSCCYVHARLWRIWSPACEQLSRRLASQFGWVRPVRCAQGAAGEGEGC